MRKSQIEITNVMFMHLIGLIGILTFTFLFISLISGSSARAEGLREETLYYNYGRRLISSSDCFAYSQIIPYYNGVNFKSFSRVKPGVIDVSKLLNYDNQNCLRYDLVSGSFSGDPQNPYASYPVMVYEVYVKDLITGQLLNFSNDVYSSVGSAIIYEICDPSVCNSPCYYECEELLQYKYNDLVNYEDTSLDCDQAINKISFGSVSRDSIIVSPRVNCWSEEFNDVSRNVEPYNGYINCSIAKGMLSGTTSESGNVFETQLQYAVNLRYNTGINEFVENPGLFTVKFCVIKIPTMCDPFFSSTTVGAYNLQVYQPEACEELGLPLI
ncbi:MAG: hypothetical protein JW791_00980 [Nanoarchaeota archaeon]|nr:hypothetical protein [Nanoarchaeota archaeon]